MDTFSGEISIAELTALLFIVSLTLIPLTIWGVWYLEQSRLSDHRSPSARVDRKLSAFKYREHGVEGSSPSACFAAKRAAPTWKLSAALGRELGFGGRLANLGG
jgi:hypothetical protein